MLIEGEKIYKQTCISCDGKNGESNDAMNLVVKPRKLNKTILTQEQSYEIIKEGGRHWGAHSDIMPAFKYVYSDAQIKAVSLYITQEFNPTRLQENYHETFHQGKIRCYGDDGFGNP